MGRRPISSRHLHPSVSNADVHPTRNVTGGTLTSLKGGVNASSGLRVPRKWCHLNPLVVKAQFPILHLDHIDSKHPMLCPRNHPPVWRTTALLHAHHPKNASPAHLAYSCHSTWPGCHSKASAAKPHRRVIVQMDIGLIIVFAPNGRQRDMCFR